MWRRSHRFSYGRSSDMGIRFSRRSMMQGVGGVALAQSLVTAEAAPAARKWPIEEGPDTPKICLALGDGGGPLPASMQPPAPSAAAPATGAAGPGAAAGRGGRGGGFGGGYGGFLAPQTEPPPPPPPRRCGWTGRPRRFRRQSRRQLSAHPATWRDSSAGRWNRGLTLDRGERTPRRADRQGCRTGGLQRDDQPPEQRHLRSEER